MRIRSGGSTQLLTVIPIETIRRAKCPLGDARRRDTSPGPRIALETTVAASSETRIRTRVSGKVAVAATPDATGFPVVGDRKGADAPSWGLPAGLDRRDGRADVEVGLLNG